MKNQRYIAQLNRVLAACPLTALDQKTIFLSGGTGMIGGCVLDLFALWNYNGGNIHVVASSRNTDSIQLHRSQNYLHVEWVEWDITQPLTLDKTIDYIIHAASNSDPVNFGKYPVDTLWGNVMGIRTLLEYARTHNVTRTLYVSSGEMYGQANENFEDFTEGYCGPIPHESPRACYPAGKRAAEVLCQSYIAQYGVDAVIVRPCHIFGPTMARRDSRAVSEFLKNAANKQPIVMKSAGMLERSHCYVVDTAIGILRVLLSGEMGAAYNVADKSYQMLIRDFAQAAAVAGGTSVTYENPSDIEAKGYSLVSRAVLNADKLIALGWTPNATNGTAIADTVAILREGI